MSRYLTRTQAVVLGMFVAAGLALFVIGIFAIGQERWLFGRTFTVQLRFPHIGGIVEGTRVRVQGINAGVVDRIIPPEQPGQPVTVVVRLDHQLQEQGLIRSNATAGLVTQGVVGAKVIEIHPGSPNVPQIGEGATIEGRAPVEVSDVIEQVSQLADHVRKGEGSLGKFVVDDEAHRQVLRLLKQGERTLRTLEEDLRAIRAVWPLSTYFEKLGLHDTERLLFRPDARSHRRVLASEDLFQSGQAVLTTEGKRSLDAVGEWLQGFRGPGSEIVVAAFTDQETDQTRARILTQNQAEAVRDYLVENFSIGSLSLFRGRKVTAAGMGSSDAAADSQREPSPPNRVEIIVFVPSS